MDKKFAVGDKVYYIDTRYHLKTYIAKVVNVMPKSIDVSPQLCYQTRFNQDDPKLSRTFKEAREKAIVMLGYRAESAREAMLSIERRLLTLIGLNEDDGGA